MKKTLVALLIIAVMLGTLIGCGAQASSTGTGNTPDTSNAAPANGVSGDPDDWPVIAVQSLSYDMPDETLVEDALNEYLVSINAGAKVDLIGINFGDLATQMTLMLSDNQNPLDIFCWRFYSNIDSCVKNEQCISLEPYLDTYPELWGMYPENVLKTQQVAGVQYAVPSVDSYATYEVYALRKDIAEELGIADRDGERITMDEMTGIMKDAKAIHPEFSYMVNTNSETVIGIDSLGNPNWLGVLLNRGVDTKEIVNLYETDTWRDYCYRMKEWKDAGLQMDDPLNNEMTITQYNNGVSAGCFLGGYSAEYIKALISYSPYEPIEFQLTDMTGTSASVLGGWMVSTVCKTPDAAMNILNLMATDEVVARYMILGIEGHNYTVDDQGIARFPEGVDTSNATWNMNGPWYYPNQCLSLPLEVEMPTYYTDMLDAPNHAKFSEAMGFIFDSAPVYDQMAACTTVVAEYRDALLYGLVDVDSYLDKFNEELKTAGIDDIIAEEQRQFDAWLAA